MVSPNWQQIKKRIGERTGLKTDEEIEAYAFFCDHSDFKNGVIMYGDVQHEFYNQLAERASPVMRQLERIFNDALGNHIHEDLEGVRHPFVVECGYYYPRAFGDTAKCSRPESPVSRQAKKVFAEYYHKFVEQGLISLPKGLNAKKSADAYPKLTGYNYFNDKQFYRKEGKNGRTLVA